MGLRKTYSILYTCKNLHLPREYMHSLIRILLMRLIEWNLRLALPILDKKK